MNNLSGCSGCSGCWLPDRQVQIVEAELQDITDEQLLESFRNEPLFQHVVKLDGLKLVLFCYMLFYVQSLLIIFHNYTYLHFANHVNTSVYYNRIRGSPFLVDSVLVVVKPVIQ